MNNLSKGYGVMYEEFIGKGIKKFIKLYVYAEFIEICIKNS